jgi:hypothetical protein
MEWIVLVIFLLWLFGRARGKSTVPICTAQSVGCGLNYGGDTFPGCVSPPVAGVCGNPVHPPPHVPIRPKDPFKPINPTPITWIGNRGTHIVGPIVGCMHRLSFPICGPPPIAVQKPPYVPIRPSDPLNPGPIVTRKPPIKSKLPAGASAGHGHYLTM